MPAPPESSYGEYLRIRLTSYSVLRMERLSRFGVGPKITLSALASAAAAGAATYAWPGVLRFPPHAVLRTLGIVLLAIGVPMWLIAAVSVMRAYNRDRLVTSGVYALVRNPMYSAWILLNLPGIALLFRSWPLLVAPLVPYAVFKSLIHREEEYLEQRYGSAYMEYRRRVNELIPLPRFRS